jgi:hypothetical protein
MSIWQNCPTLSFAAEADQQLFDRTRKRSAIPIAAAGMWRQVSANLVSVCRDESTKCAVPERSDPERRGPLLQYRQRDRKAALKHLKDLRVVFVLNSTWPMSASTKSRIRVDVKRRLRIHAKVNAI